MRHIGAVAPARAALIGALAGAVLAVVVAVGSGGTAQAYSSAGFCDQSYQVYIPAGGRCVDNRRVRHRTVQATPVQTLIGPGTYCSGAKENSDGTGGNSLPFACGSRLAQFTRSGPYPSGVGTLGYATIINTLGEGNFFVGYMEWYP